MRLEMLWSRWRNGLSRKYQPGLFSRETCIASKAVDS